jgi:hypothetical protein
MKKLRPILTALVALLFYTITDILIWQRIFEANQMVEYADMYHTGWFVTLAGYALLGTIFLWGAWKDCLFFLVTLFIGAFSGLEDVLYYVLDGRGMPEALPWLNSNPLIYGNSRATLIGSVLFWMAVLVVLYFMLYLKQSNRRKIID